MTQIDDAQTACSGSLFVSIPKGGTHLTLKLYGRAGYLNVGWGEVEPSDHSIPREELRQYLLQNPLIAAIVDKFRFLTPESIFTLLVRHARTEIGDTQPLSQEIDPALQGAWSAIRKLGGMNLFVPRFVVSTHLFPWNAAAWRFLETWGRTGVPSIVYGYRDPRAQMVSMIKFLAEADFVSGHAITQVYRPILQELQSMDRMLSFAISDPAFPFRDAYRQNRWLLHHPKVLKLRFEDLVGEEGGGSKLSQEAAIESWAKFLAVDVPTEKLREGLFGGTKTFNKGRVDSWRDVFKTHHLREFEREFGDVLVDYGYAES